MDHESQITAVQPSAEKIKHGFLHQAGLKDLLRFRNMYRDSFSFLTNSFYSPRSSKNFLSNISFNHIRRGPHGKDWAYAHDRIKVSADCDLLPQIISKITINFTQVKHLDIICTENIFQNANKNTLSSLGLQLGTLVNLKHLSITLRCNYGGRTELVRGICRNLAGLRSFSLTTLTNNNEIKEIAEEICRRLFELRSLKIDFCESYEINKEVQKFIPKMKRLKKLQKLQLYFAEMSEDPLKKSISTICKNLTCLEHLDFRVKNYKMKFPSKTLWFIFAEITQNLANLKHLSFNFDCSGVKGNDNLYAFKQLERLKVFKLKLNVVDINPVLSTLSSLFVNNFTNLEEIHLQLGPSNQIISQESLYALIFKTSCSLANLNIFNIEFNENFFQKDGWIKKRELDIPNPFSNLKDLTLQFFDCKNTPKDMLEAFGASIGFYMPNLESLTLNFKTSQFITANGVKMFCEPISENLRNLKSLKIVSKFEDRYTHVTLSLKEMFHHIPNLYISE